jgi:membrane fusion protein, copper/silver efflux system
VRLRIDVQNPELLLQPGMFVDVEVPVVLPKALVVPVDAVIRSGRHTTVFVERRPGVFERTDVVTGWQFAPNVEIVRGLAPGDRVVVSGTFLVDSESRLRHGQTATDRGR